MTKTTHCPECGAAKPEGWNGWVYRYQAAEARVEELERKLAECEKKNENHKAS